MVSMTGQWPHRKNVEQVKRVCSVSDRSLSAGPDGPVGPGSTIGGPCGPLVTGGGPVGPAGLTGSPGGPGGGAGGGPGAGDGVGGVSSPAGRTVLGGGPSSGVPRPGGSTGSRQPASTDAQYMQQQSRVFVFSTQLANRAFEAVVQGRQPTIIAHHCSQTGASKLLEVSGPSYRTLSTAQPWTGTDSLKADCEAAIHRLQMYFWYANAKRLLSCLHADTLPYLFTCSQLL